jgi:hypothetical protein
MVNSDRARLRVAGPCNGICNRQEIVATDVEAGHAIDMRESEFSEGTVLTRALREEVERAIRLGSGGAR